MNDEQLSLTAQRIGHFVATRRKAFDATQDDLAGLAGVSTRAVSALESGKATTRLDIVLRIYAALGIDLADLIEGR